MISATMGPILTILQAFESPLFRQEPDDVRQWQVTLCLQMSVLVGARKIDAAGI